MFLNKALCFAYFINLLFYHNVIILKNTDMTQIIILLLKPCVFI